MDLQQSINAINSEYNEENPEMSDHLSTADYVRDIVNHPAFKDLVSCCYLVIIIQVIMIQGCPILVLLMPYHSNVDPDIVIGALNHMIDEAGAGKTIFYDFYSNEQKQQDPGKMNTGLFSSVAGLMPLLL